MSIDGGGTATGPKTVTGAANDGVKNKDRVKPGGDADPRASTGFLALLTSLEPESDADGRAARVDDSSDTADTPLPAPELSTQNSPIDLAMLLAQAGAAGVDRQGALTDGRVRGGRGGVRPVGVAANNNNGRPKMPDSAHSVQVAGKLGIVKQNIGALLGQTAQTSSDQSAKSAGTSLQFGVVGASQMEAHSLHLSSLMDAAAREPAISGALVSSGMGEGLLRQADRAGAKSSVLQGASGAEGLWGQPASLSGNGVDAPAAPADPSMLSFESRLAETVSYWAAQGVQNAELTLDGPAGETVEVRISLKGEDAHIDFRTDQPEIRRVLEGAAAHLKDILAGEGLVLSGVSVGSSGQDGAGAQERRNRQSARQATLITSGAAPAEARLRLVHPIARAVDIFV